MTHSLTETPRQRAEALLKIHKGACFVISSSDLVNPFCDMETEGLVKVTYTVGTAISGINVKRKGYRVRVMETELLETSAH